MTRFIPASRSYKQLFRAAVVYELTILPENKVSTSSHHYNDLYIFLSSSLEEAIISLFITPNTKDFLYDLVSGALQSFEDLKCHSCFDGLDWDEVR
jgi:hypothetical protein